MNVFQGIACGLVVVCALTAQVPALNPVVDPRGVLNEFSLQPSPTTVAPGGLLRITGLNLGPAEAAVATATPWPTKLGDTEVMVNNRLAPLGIVSSGRILCQIPIEIGNGLAQVIVRRGEAASRPARFFVNVTQPALKTASGLGFGEVATKAGEGRMVTSVATGLGVAEPRVASGEGGSTDSPQGPRQAIRGYVDGVPTPLIATLTPGTAGQYTVVAELPADWKAGQMLQVYSANRAANLVTVGRQTQPVVQFLPFSGTPPEVRSLQTSDLRSSYAALNGARDDKGCYQTWVADFARGALSAVDGCLTSANRQAPSPIVALGDSPAMAAFEGPSEAQPGSPVSAKVRLLSPLMASPPVVDLPGAAINLNASPDGNVNALIPGTPPKQVVIDVSTGATREQEMIGGGGGGLPGGGGNLGFNLQNLKVDLGDGLTVPLSAPVGIGQNQFALVVGDETAAPKKAKIGLLSVQLEVRETQAFPEGWLPLAAPAPPQQPGGGGGGLPGGPALVRLPVSTFYDAPTRTLYVPMRKTDGSADGVFAFAVDGTESKLLPLPDGWFVTSCVATIPFQSLELSRRLVLFASRAPETAVRPQCPAQGFLGISLGAKEVAIQPLQGSGQFNAAGNAGDLNDFVFGLSLDPSQPGIADTLHVLDGVGGGAFRIDVPAGVTGFAGAFPVRDLDAVIALARRTTNGDAGFLYFDLTRAEARILPTPEGFDSVAFVGVFPATRKLVARGTKPGTAGSQFLIYDLVSGDLAIVANPDGVAYVGVLPVVAPPGGGPGGNPGGGGGGGGGAQAAASLFRANPKTNSVIAVGYGSDRRPRGVVMLRLP